jgi:hypothetical protein
VCSASHKRVPYSYLSPSNLALVIVNRNIKYPLFSSFGDRELRIPEMATVFGASAAARADTVTEAKPGVPTNRSKLSDDRFHESSIRTSSRRSINRATVT